MTSPAPEQMHAISDETRHTVDDVLDYARRRALYKDVPLDKPMRPNDLARLASGSITDEGIGARRAIALFENVLAPACISTDHPGYLSFIPSAPSKASLAFDVVVSASAIYGGSWMEGAGDPAAPMLFFMHGWPDDASLWRNQFAALSEQFYCVAVTMPNFGDGRVKAGGYDFPQLVEGLAATLRHHQRNGQPVTLVTHDWGAYLGYMLQRAYPQLVRRMVDAEVIQLGQAGAAGRWAA